MFKNMIFTLLLTAVANVQAEGFFLSSTDIQGQIANAQVYNSFGCKIGRAHV